MVFVKSQSDKEIILFVLSARKESAISRLKSDKHRLEEDREELEKKIERMHSMRSQVSDN